MSWHDGHYEVEQILDRIYNIKGGIYEYKVTWRNFPAFEWTFVPEQDSYRGLIEDYDAKFPTHALLKLTVRTDKPREAACRPKKPGAHQQDVARRSR